MLVRSAIISDASGSLDGTIWARNAGGLYVRAKVTPPDVPSTRRTWIRTAMANSVARWKAELDADQRAAWEAFSREFPSPGHLGATVVKGGMDEFLHANVLRQFTLLGLGYDLGYADAPPEARGVDFDPITVRLAPGETHRIKVEWTAGQDWDADGGGILLWVSVAKVSGTRNFYARGYKPLELLGEAADIASGSVIPLGYDLAGGFRSFWRYRVLTPDGRLGPEVRGFVGT